MSFDFLNFEEIVVGVDAEGQVGPAVGFALISLDETLLVCSYLDMKSLVAFGMCNKSLLEAAKSDRLWRPLLQWAFSNCYLPFGVSQDSLGGESPLAYGGSWSGSSTSGGDCDSWIGDSAKLKLRNWYRRHFSFSSLGSLAHFDARYLHRSVLLPSGDTIVFGGHKSINEGYTDIWRVKLVERDRRVLVESVFVAPANPIHETFTSTSLTPSPVGAFRQQQQQQHTEPPARTSPGGTSACAMCVDQNGDVLMFGGIINGRFSDQFWKLKLSTKSRAAASGGGYSSSSVFEFSTSPIRKVPALSGSGGLFSRFDEGSREEQGVEDVLEGQWEDLKPRYLDPTVLDSLRRRTQQAEPMLPLLPGASSNTGNIPSGSSSTTVLLPAAATTDHNHRNDEDGVVAMDAEEEVAVGEEEHQQQQLEEDEEEDNIEDEEGAWETVDEEDNGMDDEDEEDADNEMQAVINAIAAVNAIIGGVGGGVEDEQGHHNDLQEPQLSPGGRWGHTLVSYGRYVFLFGGSSPGRAFNDLWVFEEVLVPLAEPSSCSSSSFPSPSFPSASSASASSAFSHGATASAGAVGSGVGVGGRTALRRGSHVYGDSSALAGAGGGATADHDHYNATNHHHHSHHHNHGKRKYEKSPAVASKQATALRGVWRKVQVKPDTAVPTGRGGHSSTVVGDYMYVFGGNDSQATYGDFWRISLQAAVRSVLVSSDILEGDDGDRHGFALPRWELLSRSCASTQNEGPSSRIGHSAVGIGSSIVVYGGRDIYGNQFKDDVFMYDTVRGAWLQHRIETLQLNMAQAASSAARALGRPSPHLYPRTPSPHVPTVLLNSEQGELLSAYSASAASFASSSFASSSSSAVAAALTRASSSASSSLSAAIAAAEAEGAAGIIGAPHPFTSSSYTVPMETAPLSLADSNASSIGGAGGASRSIASPPPHPHPVGIAMGSSSVTTTSEPSSSLSSSGYYGSSIGNTSTSSASYSSSSTSVGTNPSSSSSNVFTTTVGLLARGYQRSPYNRPLPIRATYRRISPRTGHCAIPTSSGILYLGGLLPNGSPTSEMLHLNLFGVFGEEDFLRPAMSGGGGAGAAPFADDFVRGGTDGGAFSRGSSPGIGASLGAAMASSSSSTAAGGGGGGGSGIGSNDNYHHHRDHIVDYSYRTASPSLMNTYAQYAAMAADASSAAATRTRPRCSSSTSNFGGGGGGGGGGVSVAVLSALSMSRSVVVEEDAHDEEY